jgi:hypothetical protein
VLAATPRKVLVHMRNGMSGGRSPVPGLLHKQEAEPRAACPRTENTDTETAPKNAILASEICALSSMMGIFVKVRHTDTPLFSHFLTVPTITSSWPRCRHLVVVLGAVGARVVSVCSRVHVPSHFSSGVQSQSQNVNP